MPAMTMPVQIVAPCPKRPTASSSTSTNTIYNNNQEIQDACHQELQQILNSSMKQPNLPASIVTTTTMNTTTTTTASQIPEVSEQQIIPRTDNPLPQDMSFFTAAIQPCLPSTRYHHQQHRPRSYSVGDNSYYLYVKKNNDLVH